MRTGFWHGQDAIILAGNRKEGYAILLGSDYPKEELKMAKKIADGFLPDPDLPEDEYEKQLELYDQLKECILYVDGDEWAEQQ